MSSESLELSGKTRAVDGLRIIAVANIVVAVNIFGFWIGFYSEMIFPIAELAPKIAHFEGYYAWEKSFTVPDCIMAIVAIVAAVRLLRDSQDEAGRLLLTAAAGAMIFLGVLDFNYAIANGMYTLGHPFSWILMSVGIGLPVFGVLTLWIIHRSGKSG